MLDPLTRLRRLEHPGVAGTVLDTRTAIPLGSRTAALLALAAILGLLGFTSLYWGGIRIENHFSVFLAGSALWLFLGAGALFAWRDGRRLGGPLDMAALAFVLYAGAWYCYAPVEFAARIEFLWILVYAGVFLAARHLLPDRRWAVALLASVVLIAAVNAAFGLTKIGQPVYVIWDDPRPDYGLRISGFFGCPNHFGNFLVLCTLAAVTLGGYTGFNWTVRILFFYLGALCSAGVYFSISRGSYLAWLTGMSVLALCMVVDSIRSGSRWIIKAGIGVAVLALPALAVLFNPTVMERARNLLHDDFRFQLFPDAWRIWLMKPLFGHGPGTFDFVHLREMAPTFQTRAIFPHNDYLNTLTDYGAVGMILVIFFVVALATNLLSRGGESGTAREQLLTRLGWAVLAAALVHASVDFNFHLPACALAFFTLTGLATARTWRQQQQKDRLPLNFLFAALALPVAAFLGWQSLRMSHAETAFETNPLLLRELETSTLAAEGAVAAAADPSNYMILTRVADNLRVRTAQLSRDYQTVDLSITQGTAKDPEVALTERDALRLKRHQTGEQALRFYTLAQRANPLDDTLLVKEAMTLDLMQRQQEAYFAYQQALKNRPHSRFFLHAYAYHLWSTGQIEAARKAFGEVLGMGPGPREWNREIMEQARKALDYLNATYPPEKPAPPAVLQK
jgi:O-antigen ligase